MKYFEGLSIELFDHVENCSTWINRDFPYYALNFAQSGTIRWKTKSDEVIVLETPVAWWTYPGKNFEYGCLPHESWDQRFICFSGIRAERMVTQHLLQLNEADEPIWQIDQPERFATQWDALCNRLEAPDLACSDETVHQFEGLLLLMRQPVQRVIRHPYSTAILALGEEIRSNPERNFDWSELAKKLGVSLVHFRRLFITTLSIPPHQFLLDARLNLSAKLLRTTFATISEVSLKAGFIDPFHFSKQFRRKFKMSPSKYRSAYSLFSPNS